MAVQTNAQVKLYVDTFMDTIRKAPVFPNGANRAYEAALMRGQAVRIPQDKTVYSKALVAAEAPTIAQYTYGTPTGVNVDAIEFKWAQLHNSIHGITPDDERNSAPDVLAEVAEQKAQEMADSFDTYCAGVLNSTSLSAVVQDLSGSATVDQSIVVGAAQNILKADGTSWLMTGTSADQATVLNGIRTLKMKMMRDNKLGRGAMSPMAATLLMHPTVWAQIEGYADSLDSGGPFAMTNLNGVQITTLLGFPVFVTTALPAVDFVMNTGELGTGKDGYPVYLMVRRGLAYAQQIFDPLVLGENENPIGRYTSIAVTGRLAFMVTDPRMLYRLVVRAET